MEGGGHAFEPAPGPLADGPSADAGGMHELSRYLFLAAAGPFILLGGLHGWWTLRDTRRPTAFWPTDPRLRDAMAASGLLLTRRTTVWRAWLGFNLSHSLGALVFGIVLVLGARTGEEFDRQAPLLLPLGLVTALLYLVLAVRFWFRAPAVAIALSVLCLVLCTLARLAGR
jgi:hypothetical protein